MYTMMGEEFIYGQTKFAALQEDHEFAKMFMTLTEELLAEVREEKGIEYSITVPC
jgi:hypothetical protein